MSPAGLRATEFKPEKHVDILSRINAMSSLGRRRTLYRSTSERRTTPPSSRGGAGSCGPGKAYLPPRSGAAPGSAAPSSYQTETNHNDEWKLPPLLDWLMPTILRRGCSPSQALIS